MVLTYFTISSWFTPLAFGHTYDCPSANSSNSKESRESKLVKNDKVIETKQSKGCTSYSEHYYSFISIYYACTIYLPLSLWHMGWLDGSMVYGGFELFASILEVLVDFRGIICWIVGTSKISPSCLNILSRNDVLTLTGTELFWYSMINIMVADAISPASPGH